MDDHDIDFTPREHEQLLSVSFVYIIDILAGWFRPIIPLEV